MAYGTKTVEERLAIQRRKNNEYGIYIACDDRSILKCVNAMLLNSGILGLADTEGKMHYLIDGRRGGNYVMDRVKEKVMTLRESPTAKTSDVEDAYVEHAISSVIGKYGFSESLTGTQILRKLLFLLYKDPGLLRSVAKRLYPLVVPEFPMSPSQVERNLRYAIKKSSKLKEETRVTFVLRKLLDQTMEEVLRQYGRPHSTMRRY